MSEDSDVKVLLDRAAGSAGDLRVDVAKLHRDIGRRRKTRAGSVTAVLVLAVAAAGLGVRAWSPSASGTPAAAPGTIASMSPGTGTGGTHAATGIDCGKALPSGLSTTGPRGMRLAVADVSAPSSSGTPDVTVRLTATSSAPVGLAGVTPLQILLVHDGTVVDRLAVYTLAPGTPRYDHLASSGSGQGGGGGVGYTVQLSPGSPWTVTVSGPGHCAGADWGAARRAGGYALLAVMSVPRVLDEPQTGSGDALLASAPVSLPRG